MTEKLSTIVENNIPSFKIEIPKLESLETYD